MPATRRAVLGAALAGLAGPAAADTPGAPGLPDPLAPFFRALSGSARAGNHTAVLQIGDSHTADDGFTGHLRRLLQDRFGDGGRGTLPPTPLSPGEGWRTVASAEGAPGPFGFSGQRRRADGPATLTLPPGLAPLGLGLLLQQGGGTLDVTAGGQHAAVRTAGPTGLLTVPTAAGPVVLSARGDGPVDLLSWTALRPGGVAWSNLGTGGATVDLLFRWSPPLLAAEAGALDPALLVLAFGTNEALHPRRDFAPYPDRFAAALALLRAAAPRAGLLVLGPPGVARRRGPGPACAAAGYAVPPDLAGIRAAQRDAAARQGAAFWDWSAPLGGDCGTVVGARADPPTVARDHVHLLPPGQAATADALFAWLMQGYDAWQAGRL